MNDAGTGNVFCLECSMLSLSERGGLLEIEKLHLIQILKDCICYALIHPHAFSGNRYPLLCQNQNPNSHTCRFLIKP